MHTVVGQQQALLDTSRTNERGIFCIEGEWGDDLMIHSSVQPLLEYVSSNLTWLEEFTPRDAKPVRSIYRRAATEQEFRFLTNRWIKELRYTIGYFAFHGSSRSLKLSGAKFDGKRATLTLMELAEILAKQCAGKHIVISSCCLLEGVPDTELDEFRTTTEARSVSAYSKSAKWFECSALDLLLMTKLLVHDDPEEVEKQLNELCSGLISEYGFAMNYERRAKNT